VPSDQSISSHLYLQLIHQTSLSHLHISIKTQKNKKKSTDFPSNPKSPISKIQISHSPTFSDPRKPKFSNQTQKSLKLYNKPIKPIKQELKSLNLFPKLMNQ
jgi:CHAT domain-containing protein